MTRPTIDDLRSALLATTNAIQTARLVQLAALRNDADMAIEYALSLRERILEAEPCVDTCRRLLAGQIGGRPLPCNHVKALNLATAVYHAVFIASHPEVLKDATIPLQVAEADRLPTMEADAIRHRWSFVREFVFNNAAVVRYDDLIAVVEAESVLAERQLVQSTTKLVLDENTFLSCPDLASKYEVNYRAFAKRLERWRPEHGDDWQEVDRSERWKRGPQYLYRETAVQAIIAALRSSG
jgi:hypothetical protein